MIKQITLLGALFSGVALGAPQRRTFSGATGGYLTIEALRDDLLHFEVAAGSTPSGTEKIYTTPMVAKTDYAGPTRFDVNGRTVETLVLKATVESDLCVTVVDKVRGVTLHRLCPQNLGQSWKTLVVDSPATKNVYGLGQYFSEESPNGDWIGRVWDPLADGYGARLRGFAGGANDFSMFPIMYALGDGTQSYALFVDVVYKQMWDFRQSPWQVGMWGDQLRWYVLAGQDLPALRRSYMELTGRPPVPPKRSFGLWVSEFGFTKWDEVDTALASLRAQHFPVDGFALDLQWFGGSFGDPDRSKMGSLTWDEQAFPHPRDKIREYADDQGVNLMLIEEPYISRTLGEHEALGSRGYLAKACESCGPTYLNYNPWWGRGGMVDYTNQAAGDFWHDYRRQALAEMGVLDHWADLGEPEQFDATSWYFGFPELGKHGHADIHNMYGFRWMESIWRGYQRHRNAKRPFLLSRTGTSGIQRLGVGVWSGDIGSNWGNLRSQMNVQMHMSLSGVDYYGSDVGGFQPSRDNVEGGSELLYTQWFAAAAAFDVPVRPHAWNLDKRRPTAPSVRGDAASNLGNLRLRYELAPYYYSLAHMAHDDGDPVFPPLVHYFQSDVNVRRIGDEKLIGKDLLVALAADAKAVSRSVYLPAGDWADLRSGVWMTSSGESFSGYPLYSGSTFRLPMFARAGAIIPTAQVDEGTLNIRGKRTDGSVDDTLGLKVFPAKSASTFALVEDDGESMGGTRAVTTLGQRLADDGQSLTVEIGARQGTYAGAPAQRPYVVEIFARDAEAVSATLNGTTVPGCTAGVGTSPCFTNGTSRIVVNTGDVPVTEAQTLVVALRATTPQAPSLSFVCRNAHLAAGSSVYAVGGAAMLGDWSAARAVRLRQATADTWMGRIGSLPSDATIEWKCIQKRDDGTGAVIWQAGGNNVTGRTAAAGFSGETVGAF